MIRPTLGMVRNSSLPVRAGICPGDLSAIASLVNEAQERLLNDPLAPDEGWWGGWARMAFNVQSASGSAHIVTPNDIARLIVMNVCDTPVRIRNGFYEFLEFGIGSQPHNQCCGTGTNNLACECGTITQAYERDNIVTLAPQTVSPATIRFYPTDNGDFGKAVLLQGLDQNNQPVRSIDIETKAAILGEYIQLNFPFVDSAYQYTSITGIIKAATVGPLTIQQIDPNTLDAFTLSSMEPNETTASYRRYLVDGLKCQCCNTASGTVQVMAQAKFDFVPVVSESDYLLIKSIPAIIEEVQSIIYSTKDSAEAARLEQKHHMKALQLLFGQIDHYMGKTNTAIRVPIFGSDRVRLQPK